MDPSHLGENGHYLLDTYPLGGKTFVFDRKRNEAVMLIDGVVVLPIGAEIELTAPNVNATVTGVRLLTAGIGEPVHVCLDVEVPGSYWGEDDAKRRGARSF